MGISDCCLLRSACLIAAKEFQEKKRDLIIYIYQRKEKWIKKKEVDELLPKTKTIPFFSSHIAKIHQKNKHINKLGSRPGV